MCWWGFYRWPRPQIEIASSAACCMWRATMIEKLYFQESSSLPSKLIIVGPLLMQVDHKRICSHDLPVHLPVGLRHLQEQWLVRKPPVAELRAPQRQGRDFCQTSDLQPSIGEVPAWELRIVFRRRKQLYISLGASLKLLVVCPRVKKSKVWQILSHLLGNLSVLSHAVILRKLADLRWRSFPFHLHRDPLLRGHDVLQREVVGIVTLPHSWHLWKSWENLETKLPWKTFSGWSPCRTQRWPWRQAWQLLTLVEAGHVLVCPRQHWTQLLLLVRRRQTLPLLLSSLPVSKWTSTPSLDFGQKSPCLFQGGVDHKLSILSNSNGDGGEQEGERDGGVEES